MIEVGSVWMLVLLRATCARGWVARSTWHCTKHTPAQEVQWQQYQQTPTHASVSSALGCVAITKETPHELYIGVAR